ncbi:glycosyl hydrolase 115 family protein [Chitinophaga japonensis]|uniref:Glycosyl hydrolase family 115 (Putative glucuronidase) n=1 Tax=Chitinophaga japonensis TaxID=104662 RepID=A0A562SSP6_CHIJA|nr:glycosyl hydrolase 115 family protein [Chitinophaga japonensis]TWI84128.1 glycosyl hydrolase family 115 (putative glucuronidase) [Chitinophaga japonensis]
MKFVYLSLLLFTVQTLAAQSFISTRATGNSFPIVAATATPIYVDTLDDWLVGKAALLLQADIERVTGKKPAIIHELPASAPHLIIIGTLQGSALPGRLQAAQKTDLSGLSGQWEAGLLQTVEQPVDGIGRALLIAGSDKRGAAYTALELSRQLGVSPWYWWADVPVKTKRTAFVKAGAYHFPSPSVKYRGIFINDEAPAFSGWTKEKFGGVNHLVYEKVFELLLRLKGNYLWPAMWGNAFNDDDTLNPVLADKWGIVMGTSHHEPMLRAQQEWKRYGKGPWDYTKNAPALRDFWRTGIEHMGAHESIVTIGMRGDGDMPMTRGTAISLLEDIVRDQRQIIAAVTGKPAAQTPQMWALYKEVQDYYDKGMRVPDDVTLLLCDDNWGNIRRLPKPGLPPRSGGYGIYYHFDYVGGPRNYKWINTNNIARVWEQMHLAYQHGVDRVWIVNVGDIKPMELPISFFLDYAWNTAAWQADNLPDYFTQWASEQFGPAHAPAIGSILRRYAQYASRRKPELLDAGTYHLTHYDEADRILAQWNELENQAEKINEKIAPAYRDAYSQLVLYPVKTFTNLHRLYHAVAKNRWYAARKSVLANEWADKAKQYYLNDSLLSRQYNRELAGGKWNHMMDQTHIGYTYWQQPEKNTMPAVSYVGTDTAAGAPVTDPEPRNGKPGYVSLLATQYAKAVSTPAIQWKAIPDIGREGGGMTSFPVTAAVDAIGPQTPHLEYQVQVADTGMMQLRVYFSPSLDFYHEGGLQYGVSIDDEPPQLHTLNAEEANQRVWGAWVANNIIVKTSRHHIATPGRHVIKYWMRSPGVVLQKLVLDSGDALPSYLGPPARHP